MIDNLIDSDSLRAIGMTPQIVQQLRELPPLAGEPHVMRVTEMQREGLTLHDGQLERPARVLPALLRALDGDGDALAVGDWVLAEQLPPGEWWVHTRMPPLTQIARRLHDGRDKVSRAVIVSNVDVALLVMGLDMDFNLRRLERYLALASGAGVAAVVVLTKADLCSDVEDKLRGVHRLLPSHCGVVAVNALSGECRSALAAWLQPGQTLVLVGSSGAGKSTLTNT
jgi:ribosome biogenesis GTPase